MHIIDYKFVFEGWHPPDTEVISTGWGYTEQVGPPYIRFSAVVRVGEQVIILECQCDPCDVDAQVPYREMVHVDLAQAITKALRAVKSARAAKGPSPVPTLP